MYITADHFVSCRGKLVDSLSKGTDSALIETYM